MNQLLEKTMFYSKYRVHTIIASVIVLAIYLYSFIEFQMYCQEGEIRVERILFTAGLYVMALVLLWWKNELSDKINMFLAAVYFVATPVVCYFMLEFTQHEWGALLSDSAGYYVSIHILNVGIYAFVMCLLFLVTGSFRISAIVTYVAFILMGAAMYYVMVFRGVALIAADFFSMGAAMNVASSYDFTVGFPVYFGISIALVGIIGACKIRFKVPLDWKKRVIMLIAAVMLCLAFVGVYIRWERLDGYKVRLWRPQEAYAELGSMLAMTRSVKFLVIEKPEGYSVEEAKKIALKYVSTDGGNDDSVAVPGLEKGEHPNVIVIMNEAFCDLNNLGVETFETNKDVLHNFYSLVENTQRGDLYVSNIGGGTAIMEFEMLTGHTNGFLPLKTIAYQTLIRDEAPSLASYYKKLGYQGIYAIHPYYANGYSRDKAYPLMGFNDYISLEDFENKPEDYIIGEYISDKTAFEKIIEKYETSKATSSDPFFTFEITMQNHSPYTTVEDPEVLITTEKFKNQNAQDYLNRLYESDKAFGELIEYFEKVDEPVLVVMFGDHPPNLPEIFYDNLMNMPLEAEYTDKQLMEKRLTPLIMWANYDIEEKDLGPISTNYISGYIMDNMGVERTGYQKFLEEVRQSIPVINGIGYIGADGNYYEVFDKTSPYYDIIREYNIIEYNCLVDTKNRIDVKGFFD